jgi:allantoinase
MKPFDLLIRGNIVSSDEVLQNGYVGVARGKVATIDSGLPPKADEVIDARGRWILPGLIDAHIHAGSQAGREGIGIATRAAAAGGITTIADMPYDDPDPVTTAERFMRKVDMVNQTAYVDVALFGTIAKIDGVKHIPELIQAGVSAFKFSTYETHPQRFPRIAALDLLEAFRVTAPSAIAPLELCHRLIGPSNPLVA